jgi:class 3 adenylate cyclase
MERTLVADMVGYSRLMEGDELGTLERHMEYQGDLINPGLTRYQGRIIKTTGDGLLAEFPSVVEAVACALSVSHLNLASKAYAERLIEALRTADMSENRLNRCRTGLSHHHPRPPQASDVTHRIVASSSLSDMTLCPMVAS